MPLPPRILFSTGVFPPAIGGPATVVARLTEELTRLKYRCAVLTFGLDDAKERPYRVARISLSIPQPLRFLLVLGRTLSLARSTNVIYAFDTYSHGFAAALVARFLKKPLILRFTGDSAWEAAYASGETKSDIISFQNEKHSSEIAQYVRRRNKILATAKIIVTDCEFLKKLLISMGVAAEKITIINNAVDAPQKFSDQDVTSFKARHNITGKVALTMGRLVPWKGIAAVIDAVSNATLLVAGDGPDRENLEHHARQSGKTVIFLGNVTDKKEKALLYAGADVFVLNTNYEGMSNTLLEAMAAGLPVVTTSAGGNTEFITQKNGVLVEYNNTPELVKALASVLTDTARAAHMGSAGRERAKQYTWSALVQKNIEVIESVI